MTPQATRFAKLARWTNHGMVALIVLLAALWYFHA